MIMAKLSVLITVYNTQVDMLKNCIDSIFCCSIKDSLEIILIDDGSTVDYSNIVKEYESIKYYKIPHQGTLKARIFAIQKAECEFCAFVDADDSVSSLFLEGGVSAVTYNNADIAINDWAESNANYKTVCYADNTIKNNLSLGLGQTLDFFFDQKGKEHSVYVLWNKVFRRQLLEKVVDKISEYDLQTIVYGEDVLICFFAYCFANRIVNTHVGLYFYTHHDSQQTSLDKDIEKLLFHSQNLAKVFEVIKGHLKDQNLWQKYQQFVNCWRDMAVAYLGANTGDKAVKKQIANIFGLAKLRKPKTSDGKVYLYRKVLPNNFDFIDEQILKIRQENQPLKVYACKNSYAKEQLERVIKAFNLPHKIVNNKNDAEVVMPKEKYTFKHRLVTNKTINVVGLTLFPKGSKIRLWLKKKVYK